MKIFFSLHVAPAHALLFAKKYTPRLTQPVYTRHVENMTSVWIGETTNDFTRSFVPRFSIPLDFMKHSFNKQQHNCFAGELLEYTIIQRMEKAKQEKNWDQYRDLLAEYLSRH